MEKMLEKKYKSIFISDIHLGTKGCKAEILCDFLKHNISDNLFLVGDIIDGWRLERKFYWPQSHSNVIRRILTAAKRGTNVVYIIGNHDEVLRKILPFRITFGDIKLENTYRYNAIDGKTYLILHGDLFDTAIRNKLKFLYHLGDAIYDILLELNHIITWVRNIFKLPYWSLSGYLKGKTKEAVAFMSDFQELITEYCAKKKADGVICGHIHHAAIEQINGIVYMNDGDWVESCTALVEHYDGRWEIIKWNKEKPDVVNGTNSSKPKQSKRPARKNRVKVRRSTSL
jgi:UDP-2,3-diacylglucosamine pyrophosphatase LpxH